MAVPHTGASKQPINKGAKSTASNGGFLGFPWYVWALLGTIVVVLGLVIFGTSGSKQAPVAGDQQTQKFDVPSSDSKGGQYTRDTPVNANLVPDSGVIQRVYIDPVTQQEMIDSPNGAVATSSPEGQMLVAENDRLIAASSGSIQPTAGSKPADVVAPHVQELHESLVAANEQSRLLDEKINAQNQKTTELQSLIKMQQETILAMSRQISSIEPIVASQRQLLALENNDAEKIVLKKAKTPTVVVQAIVGNVAWVEDGNKKISSVSVGDNIPATNLIVRAIDAADNMVIVTAN